MIRKNINSQQIKRVNCEKKKNRAEERLRSYYIE